jgi:hypothetical protein
MQGVNTSESVSESVQHPSKQRLVLLLHGTCIYLYLYLYPQSHPTLADSSRFPVCDLCCCAGSTRRHGHWERNDAWADRRSIHRHGWIQWRSSSLTDTPARMRTHKTSVTSKKCLAQENARSGSRYMSLCLLVCECVCVCSKVAGTGLVARHVTWQRPRLDTLYKF